MARRRSTVKRIDPWSVLKFGFVVNLALLAVGLLVAAIVWMIIDRLELVDQACSIALDVGFTACGVNAGNLFRALILLGLLWVVVQTAVLVFLAFLYNLIADLTGGLTFGIVDDTPAGPARTVGPRAGAAAGAGAATTGRRSGEFDRPAQPRGTGDFDRPGQARGTGEFDRPGGEPRHQASTPTREPFGRAGAQTGRPPVPPLGADPDGTGSWTDGFVIDEGAPTGQRPSDNERDDDLFGPR
ncbi:DUF3566 domain-containing protein [Egicoccus sp. AB-alg2]|uniref:DUF3566 domain-containing protein n=1 Tax=Egicoccus sp. AB-alg2 TaxID=3242693 RepID=UPI00359ED390